MSMKLDYAFVTSAGPRADNEDAVGYWLLPNGGFALAIADGLGGHSGGKRASAIAIDRFGAAVTAHERASIRGVAAGIHSAILEEQGAHPGFKAMATTLSAAVGREGKLELVHCGDTRLALQRGSGIKHLTQDHTEARRLLAAGKLTKSEYISYPRKNILDSALGGARDPQIDHSFTELLAGDRIFATSDGVHGKVFLREMKAISDQVTSAAAFVDLLEKAVLERVPDDNFTAAALFILE